MIVVPAEILRGLLTGVVAGFASGLLGVSPGGILVPVISLTLRFPQHLAQAVSLVAQAPPTSLTGISNYAKSGRRVSFRWVVVLALGFVIGGPVGAAIARQFNDRQLRWMFVSYLLLLALLSAIKGTKPGETKRAEQSQDRWIALSVIGFVAGVSSGLLGIGGGLVITACSVVLLRIGQHQAQALSLILTALPLTLPAAWMYIRQGWHLPWWAVAGIILGLVIGTKLGAVLANKLPERALRWVFIALILGMAIYMGISA